MTEKGKFEPRPAFALTDVMEGMPTRYEAIMAADPRIPQAAQAIHEGFHWLMTEDWGPTGLGFQAVHVMLFASHHAWIGALTMAAAGHADLSLMALRRAIEFGCYASKVAKNDQRAKDWARFLKDPAARQRFCGQTKIPDAFDNKRYRHLWPLLVLHDDASNLAVHANISSLGELWGGAEQGLGRWDYHVNATVAFVLTVRTIDVGRQLLRTFYGLMADRLADNQPFEEALSAIDRGARQLLVRMAQEQAGGRITAEAVQAIMNDDRSLGEQKFRALMAASQERKAKGAAPAEPIPPRRIRIRYRRTAANG